MVYIDLAIFWFLLLITPGIDFMLIIKNSSKSIKYGILTATGITIGISIYIITISIFLTNFNKQFLFYLSIMGYSYLIYLGIKILINIKYYNINMNIKISNKPFFEGFITNLLNPKVPILVYSVLSYYSKQAFIFYLGLEIILLTFVLWSLIAILNSYLSKIIVSIGKYIEIIAGIFILSIGIFGILEAIKH